MTIALLFSSGTCIVQIQSARENFACKKGLFNLSAEVIINARNARLWARCAIFPMKIKQTLFFAAWSRGLHFEETPTSIQDVIRDVYCPGKCCSHKEKCESLDGVVTTPRSIYSCGKCGAWLFVHEVLFMLQEHVKTTKIDKTRFFFAKKRWTWYPTNNC